ncbi:hypothetical protein M948_05980 [Virgibacillus sp. CM-4]|uniref:ABC transporter ATP-binding protein n=1 Tax=Virgibacillus sp. CM-4 TaxID=1354277 RepID=UPI0003889518|nr:ATP-binding cassette domain-containing protein [Virgibacillus sp. CM-4]EQB38121.1 hypothetical protein M948_05980 [Virgibacillus sp. CM-4]
MKPIVKFSNVSKTYHLFKKKSDQLLDIFSLNKDKKSFSALWDISFEVYRGETIGIIGVNGSGKSTLSNLLAQVVPPTSGDIHIDGETSLVAISAGLNNFVTGRENIELKCLMHGMKKKEIEQKTPSIIEFADIGEFIDQPIKSYSSGMKSRLGFAISVHIQPDILVIDEALSVGDSTFYKKCQDKFAEFKKQGKTIFFISHSITQVQSISDRIMWLNFGEIKRFDDKEVVATEYKKFIKWFNGLTSAEKKQYRTKMLNQQMDKKNANHGEFETLSLRRNTKRTKKRKKSSIYQVLIMFALFLTSAVLMLFNEPLEVLKETINGTSTSQQSNEKPNVSNVNNQDDETIMMNKYGYVNKKEARLYKDKELKQESTEVTFASKLFIGEKIGNTAYKVELSNGDAYVSTKDIIIREEDTAVSNYQVADFLPILPQSFANSYEFLMQFLNTEYDQVKNTLQGLSNEYVNEDGTRVLEFGPHHLRYIFKEGVATSLIVTDINSNLPFIDEVKSEAEVIAENDNLIYFMADTYEIILNVEAGELELRMRNE